MTQKKLMKILAALALAAAIPLAAGGFYIELGTPSASSDPQAKGTVLVARLSGCGEPEKATLTGTAEGVINGKRQSIPLNFVALSKPGGYALKQQWPSEGRWVVRLVGRTRDGAGVTSLLVHVHGDSFDRGGAKWAMRQPAKDEVEAMLR